MAKRKSKSIVQTRSYLGDTTKRGKARGKNRKATRKGNAPATTSKRGNGARIRL